MLSKTQIDRLGDRLKAGQAIEEDLRILDEYRRSFADAYEQVVDAIRQRFDVPVTGRPAKSTASIVEKLRRESIRLTQIQDIAGCRIVVLDVVAQNHLVDELSRICEGAIVVDRRIKPSHDYRAVHVIASVADHAVEIQVRTALQHKWAELSEKVSDVVDAAIKYGGGQGVFRDFLTSRSERIANIEDGELRLNLNLVNPAERDDLRGTIELLKTFMEHQLSTMIVEVESLKSSGPRE